MRIPVPDHIPAADQLGSVHFIGIGGAGLSAIARIMAQRGIRVSGSDANDSALLRQLAREGIDARAGHDPERLAGVDTVIASTAVSEDNSEVQAAMRAGIRLWPRSAAMQSVLAGQHAIAVAGTHGKTTTTSMLTLAMRAAGRDISFAIGAEVPALRSNAHHGSDEIFIVEADESDGAFLVYQPAGAIVTNIDADHLDQWHTEAAYRQAFGEFARGIADFIVVNADDAGAVETVRSSAVADVRIRTAGFGHEAQIRGTELRINGTISELDVSVDGKPQGTVRLQVPGQHYAADALFALAAGLELGAAFDDLAAGIGAYTGAQRRMEFIGEAAGVKVFDTYAHHPAEIAADLKAARSMLGDGKLIVAFQPHLASRTRLFGQRMGHELSIADILAVTDIYLARETPDPTVSRDLVLAAVTGPQVLEAFELPELPVALAAASEPGDIIITLGAGDITTIAPHILAELNPS